jgi:ornithine cyclodeaminase/alanine dehydrogenase-like protein (mu-crystallin family)
MREPETLPYLSRGELESMSISTDEVVSTIEHLIKATVESRAWNAPKVVITPPDGRYMMATLSASDDPPFLAVKSLVLNAKNRDKGLSEINSLVTLLDSDTGLPLAVIDGNWVTAIRTAGLSAVAAKHLARPESSVIAFVGCGIQAASHLQAFSDLFPLEEVRAFNRGRENRDAFCRAAESKGLVARSCDRIEEAISGADLIVTTVSLSQAVEPFIDAAWVKPGAFASVVDLGIPWIDDSMAVFDRIIIDDLAQESQMEKPLVDLSLVKGDLTGLVTGAVDGRIASDERTAFVFRGFALGDLALATLAFQASRQQAGG